MIENYTMIRNLESLTEEQRREYYEHVCQAVGLDPKQNLLKYTMLDDGTGSGSRHLVLYATKGATNAIRGIQGIDITDLTDKVIGGAVVFTAKAKNAKGRTDIAVGACSIDGKRGKILENAFALAQTRATRRVTLQMSGLDLLDESEVSGDNTVPIEQASLPLSEIGQPVQASSEPGVDITAGLSLKTPATAVLLSSAVSAAPLAPEIVPEESKRLPNPAAGLAPIAANVMAAPDGVPSVAAISDEDKKPRRKRRTKAEMEAAKTVDGEPPQDLKLVEPVAEEKSDAPSTPALASEPEAPKLVTAPVKIMIGNKPNAEQMKVFVDKLTDYRNNILPSGGMVPSHGMGVVKKVREFFRVANNGIDDLQNLTVEQWENTFRFMDTTIAQHNAKKLVEIMEFNIGATDELAKAV